MVKHYCDRCDAICDPKDMWNVHLVSRMGVKIGRSYDAMRDQLDSELCVSCVNAIAKELKIEIHG